jgi:hypothetical protein
MPIELSGRMIMFAMVIVGYLLATHWTDQVRRLLGISYFRPWRGDPWPHGVQEDDDVRWRWTRAIARPRRDRDSLTVPTQPVRATVGRPDHH